MSKGKNKSFIEELQEKYRITGMNYTPQNYAQAGMNITYEIQEVRPRTECPICGGRPNVHGYIKNDKIRNSQWSTRHSRTDA